MKKIYLDCTHTYFSGLNTGIQRVVKNITYNINNITLDNDLEIFPVILINKDYYVFEEFPNDDSQISKSIRIKIFLKSVYKKIKKIVKNLTFSKLEFILNSPKITIFLNEIADKLLFRVQNDDNVKFNSGDYLVLLDSIWYNNSEIYKKLHKKNVKIINITYDLIPIFYPQFCENHLTNAFKSWYLNNSKYMNKFISISKCVESDTYNYIKSNILKEVKKEKFDYFYLGADLNRINSNFNFVNNNFKSLFSDNTFITISTLEPRKNHIFILKSFERLWEDGMNVKYVIIGKVGWKIEEFLNYVKNHKEFNKRLFLLNDVSDNELIYAYKNSKALIFSSFTEGFGLPIIEALHNNLQVLASDIPIHREVGKNYVTYFNIYEQDSLYKVIRYNDFIKNLDSFNWNSWKDSCQDLIKKITKD